MAEKESPPHASAPGSPEHKATPAAESASLTASPSAAVAPASPPAAVESSPGPSAGVSGGVNSGAPSPSGSQRKLNSSSGAAESNVDEVESVEEADQKGASASVESLTTPPSSTGVLAHPPKKADLPEEIMLLRSAKGRVELYLEKIKSPPDIREALVELKDLQGDCQKLEEEYRAEWNALKKRYLDKFKPLYQKRKEILTNGDASGSSGTPRIPGFWHTALSHHNLINELIEPHDKDVLQFLQDITFDWVDPQEQTSYTLSFFFSPNPYFENTVLTKTYHIVGSGVVLFMSSLQERSDYDDDETVLMRTEGTEIKWHPNKNLTEKVVSRKQRNRKTGATRVLMETVDQDSFFRFFKSTELPAESEMDAFEERTLQDLEMIIEAEFEIGCTIRDKIIPRALGWHLGLEQESSSGRSENGDYNSSSDSDEEG